MFAIVIPNEIKKKAFFVDIYIYKNMPFCMSKIQKIIDTISSMQPKEEPWGAKKLLTFNLDMCWYFFSIDKRVFFCSYRDKKISRNFNQV